MKKKIHWLYNDLYYFNIYFCYGFTKEEYAAAIKKNLGYTWTREGDMPPGLCTFLESDSGRKVIFMNVEDDCDPTYLVHECVHAAHRIMYARGLEPDCLNDEAEAYLVSWIFKNCNDYKNKVDKKKMKKSESGLSSLAISIQAHGAAV